MDNWHSEWVVEGPDFDTSQNSPQFPTVQWSEGEEDITVDSPNLSRYSNESVVGEKEICEKIDSPVKTSFKNVTLAKKRLQAYTKQTNKSTSKDEKKDSEDKPEKLVAKKSKKALYPDEKAKMVIQEIEVIKKKEVEENLKKQQLFAEVLKSYTSATLRPRSRSLSSERTKHFKKREIKSRNYRRTDSIGRKSVSPDDQTRRSGRRSSPGHKKSVYPKNWTEYKQQKLTIAKDDTLKKKCFPSHSNSSIDLYNKIYNLCVPSPPIEIFRCSTEHGEKLIPTPYVRFTKSKPPIVFSVNFEVIKESYLSRKQLFQAIPKEREATIRKLIDNPSKAQPSNKRNRSQLWYHKSWKKSGEPECKILENSVGLSFLQNYSDEEEENETEEIVICSSVKKKKDQNETATTKNDKNKQNKELVNFPAESLMDDVKKQDPDSEVATLMKSPQTTQVEDQNEDRLTPIKLDRDIETDEKNEQDGKKSENNDEKTEFEERLTPIKFDLKLQIGKKNERDLEKEAANKHETKIESAVDNTERLTPEHVSYYNEMIDYSPDRLTPEEIPKCDKSGMDKFNVTKSAIEVLQKELKKRENLNEESRGKVKKKKKKAGIKRKMESSDVEDELPKAKKRKKKNKEKKKVSEEEEEEESMSSEDEKRKKKQKKGSKRKKEKSKKKRNKYKKDKKTREAKTKKKKVPCEDKSKKEKSTKKKNEASEDLTVSDESKKPKNKDKKKRRKEVSVSEDSSISKDKKVSKDISVQDQVQKMPEKKKNNDWEDEELLSNTFQVLEKERNEKINSSISSHFELVEKLNDRKSEKLEKDQKTVKEKDRRRHSKDNYPDTMSELEAIKRVDESQYSDLNRSRERGILDHSSGGGKDKERKSARGKKYADEHSDLEIESSKNRSASKERHRKQKEGKSKRIDEVRPPLFIKQEPNWEEKNSFVKKQSKRKEDALIAKNLEDFPLVKDALGVADDLDTPDTDEYRGNWEKDPFPVWESEDESAPKVKEKINTSWESDEEVYERARVIDKPLDFTEGLDLEIPLNIKPFKRREVIDADKELQLLKIESQTLNEERIQLELEKIKVKQLELSVIKEVETKEEEQPPKRRKSVEDTAKEVEDKAKRRRWDRREAEPNRKPAENIVVIDLSESTSSVNTSAVLENEYEEFIKAVTSKPPRQEDARKFNDSVISLSSFSDFSDSNCSFDNAFGKKFIDVQPLKMSTPIKNDLTRMNEAPVSQIIIAPKDIPFIPMPGEVKPVPVPSPPITAIASPGLLGLPAQILTSIIETPSNNTPEHLNTGARTCDAPTFGAPTLDAPTLQESMHLVEKPVTSTLSDPPARYKEEVVSSSLQESKVDIFENKVSENVVESTNNSTEVALEVLPEEKPSSSIRQSTAGKPFTFTSLVLPSKKLLIDNSRLNLDDSDDESKTRMKAIDEIRMEKSIRWNKLEEPKELKQESKKETKLETKPETKPETKQETKLEAKQETNQEAKQETKQEAKQETKQETKQEAKQETKQQESQEEAKQAFKGKVQEEKHEMKKSEVGEKNVKAGNRDRKQSRSRSPRSRGHHGRDRIERRGASPKRSSDSSHSSRYRRRDSSPRRRGRSPKKHSPTQSPARRNSSPGTRRRYSSRRSPSPIHRRRSPSPRRKSPKRPTLQTSSSKSRNIRSKSPQKPESTVKSHQTSQSTEKPLLETHTQKPLAITASPLEELKKSVADSTISDDSLLPQPNLEDLAESPVSHFYGRPRVDVSRQLSMNEGVRQILGYEKEDFRPLSTPKPDMSKQASMNEGVRQILGYAKEDLRPISTTYDNHGYDQNQLSQILKTIGQFSMSTKSEASTSSKSESSQENVFRNISAVSVNIEVPIKKAYKNVPTTQNSFVQVGNMVQIVPSDFNIKTENVQTVISNRHAGHENKLLQQEKKARIVQVGNMLQIVPNDSPPQPTLPPLPVLPPLPPEPKIEPVEKLKVVAKVITEQEKQSAEKAMKQKVAEQREERERRRREREARRKEKEKRRREKEKHRQVKMKQKTENMIKRALQLEVEGEEGENSLLNETPAQWPPLPSISSSFKDANKSILVLGHRKSVKLDRRKVVQFADGVRPGEGTSPSAGEELSSSPRYRKLPKEKRYTKTKMRMKDKKKKIKVKIIKPISDMDESDEDDHLPPPSPPPGSPPPHIFPPRVKPHPVNNIHPYVANLMPATQSSQSPVLYRPSLNVLLPPLPPTHHHLPPPLPLPMPPHHLTGRPPEPPMMHHGSLQGMSQLHVPPPPPPLPPTVQTAGGSHRSLSYHY